MCIRIGAPSNTELFKLALHVSAKENINLTLDEYTKLLNKSNGSIRKLLWKLSLIKSGQKEIVNTKFESPIEETIEQITDLVIKCDLNEISNIRTHIYNLIITNIEPVVIMRKIFISLYNKNIPEKIKYKIINSASYYDHNLVRRRREITHLEAFIINTMNLIYESKN